MIPTVLLIASLLLLIILAVPILCEKLHIPAIIGLILAGIVIGPQVLGIVERGPVIDTLGKLGLLYLMFMSGIEISLSDLQREKWGSILCGLYTFFVPALLGFCTGWFVFGYSLPACILLGSMLGGHTLITYPVVSRYNIQRNRAVSLVIGATVFAVTAAMVFLAVTASMARGTIDPRFLYLRMGLGSVVMLVTLFYGMPLLAEQVFKRYNDSIVEYTFVILMAALSGVLAWLAGLEPVLGVFLAGLALNRQIPNLSPLMNKINFVGNAIFIPIFLVSVGLMIDLHAFTQGWNALFIAVGVCLAAILGKWLAAWLSQQSFRLTRDERHLLFGLSNAKAAGSLAAVTIAYNVGIFDDNVLNATIIMILVTCAVSSFLTEHAAKHIALATEAPLVRDAVLSQLRLLLPVANPKNSPALVDLATMVADPETELHAMAVIRRPEDRQQVEQHLERLARMSAATDHRMNLHTQLAVNIPNGILNISAAEQITHIIAGFSDEGTGYGKALNPLLTSAEQGLWIFHSVQPIKTITNVRILAPEHAEKEAGYHDWRNLVARIVYQTRADVTQEVMTNWTVLPRIADSTAANDLLVVVQARPSTVSFHSDMTRVPEVLKERFKDKNFLVIFPRQNLGLQTDNPFFADYTRHAESSFALFERLHRKHGRS
ncbi:MAG: cation:proton antiporter [Paludibacteraceae bacterium]|nr:cation:proton antiporter [Paludibacteraceae bacterium]